MLQEHHSNAHCSRSILQNFTHADSHYTKNIELVDFVKQITTLLRNILITSVNKEKPTAIQWPYLHPKIQLKDAEVESSDEQVL